MNRKKKAKLDRAAKASPIHPFNDFDHWPDSVVGCPAPESKEWQQAFQKRIDDTFGVKDAIYLAWSGDKRFWSDEFYTDWFVNGLPKGGVEKRPILLWKTIPINEWDWVDIFPPRWLLVERHHPAQYAPTWEAGIWQTDVNMIGGKKQVRPERPPAEYFVHWRTLARHRSPAVIGDQPPCCARLRAANSICVGEYRLPNDSDLEHVAGLRDLRLREKSQRADQPINEHSRNRATRMTEFYLKRIALQKRRAYNEAMLANPDVFMGAALQQMGYKPTANEKEQIVREAIKRSENKDVII